MKDWVVLTPDEKGIVMQWDHWDRREADVWMKEHKAQIEDPGNFYFGCFLKERSYESAGERHMRQVAELTALVRKAGAALGEASPGHPLLAVTNDYLATNKLLPAGDGMVERDVTLSLEAWARLDSLAAVSGLNVDQVAAVLLAIHLEKTHEATKAGDQPGYSLTEGPLGA